MFKDSSIAGAAKLPSIFPTILILVSIAKPFSTALASPSSFSERPGDVGGYLAAVSSRVIPEDMTVSRRLDTSDAWVNEYPIVAQPNIKSGADILLAGRFNIGERQKFWNLEKEMFPGGKQVSLYSSRWRSAG